jgi:hypothetical protein
MKQRTTDIKIGADTYRFVYPYRYDMGRPCVLVFRKGPNGSPAGFGPKGFPKWMMRDGWGSVKVWLPWMPWRIAHKYRRFGAMRVYKASQRFYGVR